ncbi:MAG: S41 family peptidase [Syntrophales bacterium]
MNPFKQSLMDRMIQLFVIILLLVHYSNPAIAIDQNSHDNLKIVNDAFVIIENDYLEPVDSQKLIQGALNGMLQSLDPHSAYLSADMYKELVAETEGSFGGIGLELAVVNDILTVISPIEGTPAHKAGIRAGDQIIKIDDISTQGLSIADLTGKLRGPEGTKVKITIMRKGLTKPRDFIVTRAIINVRSVSYSSLEHNIGYIRISHFQAKTSDELKQAYSELAKRSKPLTGLILDLRNNPGGLLEQSLSVSEFFLKEGSPIVSIKGRDAIEEVTFTAEADGEKPTCPIIILINEGSASAAEIVTGALQDNGRAVVLGIRTFGKGSVQGVIPFEDGSAMMLTVARYYTPKGRSIQAEGIVPDIKVEFVEPAEQEETQMTVREKDLEGHIKSDEEHGVAQESIQAKRDLDAMKDNQLKSAIELLNSWEILRHMEKK